MGEKSFHLRRRNLPTLQDWLHERMENNSNPYIELDCKTILQMVLIIGGVAQQPFRDENHGNKSSISLSQLKEANKKEPLREGYEALLSPFFFRAS